MLEHYQSKSIVHYSFLHYYIAQKCQKLITAITPFVIQQNTASGTQNLGHDDKRKTINWQMYFGFGFSVERVML